jgi:hypothetical protein
MMAGAAIFGIFTAVLRLDDIGAPIRHISQGVKYTFENGKLDEVGGYPYYENYGQIISFIALVGLAFICYLLARWGSRGAVAEEIEATRSITPTPVPPAKEDRDSQRPTVASTFEDESSDEE